LNPSAETVVIIPAFNEEARIADVVKGIAQCLPEARILVVNDGSADQTVEMASKAGAMVISHPFNLGYGVALQTGYKYALKKEYEEVVQMDGDGQHDPSFLADLLRMIRNGDADIAIGSRFLETKSLRPNGQGYRAPLIRKLGMRFFRTITSVLIRQKVTDPTSGYQAMNRKVLEWVSSDKFPFDYPDADVIIMLHRAGFRMKEVPVRMFESQNKKSMHSGWKPVYYIFKMLLSILVTLMRE
jgi:glycosyltransferase involved in cell wall biosynthesis